MVIQPVIRSVSALPLSIWLSFAAFIQVVASDKSLTLFQYATPLELAPVAAPQLAELRLSNPMYNALRSDFADLRVVKNSNYGLVPVKVVRLGPPDHALVSPPFTMLEEIPVDLSYRYPQSAIVLLETGRVPLVGVRVALEKSVSAGDYMFLGRGGAHAAGTEWRLLKHLRVEEGVSRLDIAFKESSFMQYALVADHGTKSDFRIDSVSGPAYYAYFELQPDESYTLLCGYPDALPVLGFNIDAIDRHLNMGESAVEVRVPSLVENKMWKGNSLKGFAFQRSFLIPLAVVTALIFILCVFVIAFTIANRKRPITPGSLPRFFK